MLVSCPGAGRIKAVWPVEYTHMSVGLVPLYGMINEFNVVDTRFYDDNYNNVHYQYVLSSDTILVGCVYESLFIADSATASTTVNFLENRVVTCMSRGEAKLIFDSLAAKHCDTTFNAPVFMNDMMMTGYGYYHVDNGASMADIVGIEITSDQAWDDKHPAGSSLNDIVLYLGKSLFPYIKNGYQGEKETDIVKPLSEMQPEDYVLNIFSPSPMIRRSNFGLKFLVDPEFPVDRMITISISTDDGMLYSTSVKMMADKDIM